MTIIIHQSVNVADLHRDLILHRIDLLLHRFRHGALLWAESVAGLRGIASQLTILREFLGPRSATTLMWLCVPHTSVATISPRSFVFGRAMPGHAKR